MDDFYVLHRNTTTPLPATDDTLVWSTCLRQIAISRREFEQMEPSDQVYSSTEAMQFLLEVICGLHSPLIGETEVQGQFRQFLQKEKSHPLHLSLQSTWQKILNQAKSIRDQYLCGTGSQGYGSLTRQLLVGLPKPAERIALVGSGHLVQEMLPYLESVKDITLYVRSPKKAAVNVSSNKVKIEPLENLKTASTGILILAAPLTDRQIQEILPSEKLQMLIDYRGGDCNLPGLEMAERFYDLKMCHSLLKKQMAARQMQKEKALLAIARWKEKLESEVQIRPFGWEDLCG